MSIVEPGAEGPHAELLHVEEALFECPTEWKGLIQGDLPVRRVTVRRPTLRATRRPNGVWSAARLFPPPQFSDHPPEVKFEGGVIEIFDPQKTPASTLTLRDVNVSLVPTSVNPPLPLAGKEPTATTAVAKPGSRLLKGMFAGDGFRRVAVEGWVDFQAAACSVRGQIEGLDVSPDLRNSLPDPLAEKLLPLGNLRGQMNLRFKLDYDPDAPSPLQYDISGQLERGRIDDPRLPEALTDIRAAVHVDGGGYAIENFAGRSGQATVRMSCRRSGFASNSPLWLSAELRQFDLDQALLDVLPPWARIQWEKYRPAGPVDADVRLSFDGRQWQPEIAVRCLDVSFMHHKFPYRLQHGKGTLDLKDDQLKLVLTAYSGSQPIRLRAEFAHPLSGPIGWFEAKGDAIPLDEALIDALPEKSRKVVRSLDPRGTLNVDLRMWRDEPNVPMHKHLLLNVAGCSVRYDKFPYPLSNVAGTLEMIDDAWTFRGLEGNNDTARVRCQGSLTSGLQGRELVLNFVANDVPLEQDLRNSLQRSPHIQQVWHDLRPRGVVSATAEVRYLSDQKKFSVGVRIQPQPETASIEPVYFPYRLDRLEGDIVYRDGHVTFQGCKGEHGAVKVSAEGYSDFQRDGRCDIHFTRLSADRLRADRELTQALPERLRKAVAELNPTGPINVRGSLDVQKTGRPGEPLRSRWDVRLGLQQSSLQCGGIRLENVDGSVSLRGEFDGQRLRSRGELAVDSLSYKNTQFTRVAGPIWIDDGRVLFGSWVDRRENGVTTTEATGAAQAPRPITANLFGGKLFGDGWVALGAEPRYAVNATLTDADLARCARDVGAGERKLQGKILATADLSGSGRTRNRLSGRGTIQLSSGNVYQLPLMVALLKILSIRPPDQNAFSDATVDYRIEGEHIYFDRIDFRGDAISLRGKGQMDFQSAVEMTFYGMVGRGELDVPIIDQVFRGASQQIMLIHVGGTLQNPETRREALPAVNQALQQLRDELQK